MAALGFEEPHEWQRHALDVAMECHPTDADLPAYRTVGLCVMRQAGKTALIAGRIIAELRHPRRLVAYTAQDRNLAREKWEEHCLLVLASPIGDEVADYRRSNGSEMLRFRNGSSYIIVTPSPTSARGRSIDLAVIDEAMAHRSAGIVSALTPTMAAKRHAQLFLCGNAGDENSALFQHYRDIGRGLIHDEDSSMAWLEWAPREDDFDSYDLDVWRQAIPTLERPNGISLLAVKDAARTLDEITFRREFLNVWSEGYAAAVIDPDAWAACAGSEPVPDPIFLGFDMTPERDRACLVAAGAREGRVVVEVIAQSEDVRAVVERTVEVALRFDATVLLHRLGPGGGIEFRLERDNVPVRSLGMAEVVTACGMFYDAIQTRTLRHPDDPRLTESVVAAIKRPSGDRWRWARRPGGDISVLSAATVAVFGALTMEPGTPAIY